MVNIRDVLDDQFISWLNLENIKAEKPQKTFRTEHNQMDIGHIYCCLKKLSLNLKQFDNKIVVF